MNISMILSGGRGKRFGGEVPKQYLELLGKEIIGYTVDAIAESSQTDAAFIVCDAAYAEHLQKKYHLACICGGASRNESLKKGLDYIKANGWNCEKVFITEAARPFLKSQIVDRYIGSLDEFDAVITAKKITDSLGKRNEAVTCRDDYYLIQAPEAFRFELLYRHFEADSDITATVQQLPPERKVMEYYEFHNNIKITYPQDILIAEQMMKYFKEVGESGA